MQGDGRLIYVKFMLKQQWAKIRLCWCADSRSTYSRRVCARCLGHRQPRLITYYWRTGSFAYVSNKDIRRILKEMAASGECIPVEIEGESGSFYMDPKLLLHHVHFPPWRSCRPHRPRHRPENRSPHRSLSSLGGRCQVNCSPGQRHSARAGRIHEVLRGTQWTIEEGPAGLLNRIRP